MGQMTADVLMGCDWGYCWCTEELTPAWCLFVSSSRMVLHEGWLDLVKAGQRGRGEKTRLRHSEGDREPLVSWPDAHIFSWRLNCCFKSVSIGVRDGLEDVLCCQMRIKWKPWSQRGKKTSVQDLTMSSFVSTSQGLDTLWPVGL